MFNFFKPKKFDPQRIIKSKDANSLCKLSLDDFTELSKKVSEGGRYSLNSYFDRVSYNGLDCESEEIVFEGKNCSFAGADKYLYYDIKENKSNRELFVLNIKDGKTRNQYFKIGVKLLKRK